MTELKPDAIWIELPCQHTRREKLRDMLRHFHRHGSHHYTVFQAREGGPQDGDLEIEFDPSGVFRIREDPYRSKLLQGEEQVGTDLR